MEGLGNPEISGILQAIVCESNTTPFPVSPHSFSSQLQLNPPQEFLLRRDFSTEVFSLPFLIWRNNSAVLWADQQHWESHSCQKPGSVWELSRNLQQLFKSRVGPWCQSWKWNPRKPGPAEYFKPTEHDGKIKSLLRAAKSCNAKCRRESALHKTPPRRSKIFYISGRTL